MRLPKSKSGGSTPCHGTLAGVALDGHPVREPAVAIRAEFAALEAAALAVIGQAEVSEEWLSLDRDEMAHSRRLDPA
jgi:hypothetical protein